MGGLQLNTEILQQEGRSFLRCFYYLDGNPESKQEEIEIEAKLEGIPNNTVEIAEKINAHPILGDIDIFVWDNATDDMIGDNCWKCVSWPKDESEVLMLEKKPPRL